MRHDLLLAPLVCAHLLACGSSEAPARDEDGSSSGTSTSSGGSSGDPPVDAGRHCQIVTAGPRVGTVLTSVARSTGGVPWTELDGARDADDTFAKAMLGDGEESEELQITGFGFDLPQKVTFQGVEVQLRRHAPEGGIADGTISLIGVPNQIGRGKFIATPWPISKIGTHHYGQATDTWGMDLNSPDVTQPDFGVALWVKRAPGGPSSATALVDSIRVRVFYCL